MHPATTFLLAVAEECYITSRSSDTPTAAFGIRLAVPAAGPESTLVLRPELRPEISLALVATGPCTRLVPARLLAWR